MKLHPLYYHRQTRLYNLRQRAQQRRLTETVEQRDKRLEDLQEYAQQRRLTETVEQWRSQNTADARAQRGHTMFASSLVPRPRPALSCLQYGMQKKLGGSGDALPENFGIFELHRSILKLL